MQNWNKVIRCLVFAMLFAATRVGFGQEPEKNLGLQLESNPPMQVIARTPPEPEIPEGDFEIREGYKLIETLDEFRDAIKKDGQKIRLKPGDLSSQSSG